MESVTDWDMRLNRISSMLKFAVHIVLVLCSNLCMSCMCISCVLEKSCSPRILSLESCGINHLAALARGSHFPIPNKCLSLHTFCLATALVSSSIHSTVSSNPSNELLTPAIISSAWWDDKTRGDNERTYNKWKLSLTVRNLMILILKWSGIRLSLEKSIIASFGWPFRGEVHQGVIKDLTLLLYIFT